MIFDISSFEKNIAEWTELFFGEFNDSDQFRGINFTWDIFKNKLLPKYIKQQVFLHDMEIEGYTRNEVESFAVFISNKKINKLIKK